VDEVELVREPKHRVRYLTEEEERFLAACKPELRRVVEFALHTGIRKRAILALRWRDVVFATGSIWVPEDLSKSRKPYFVPMNARVRDVLNEARCSAPNTRPDGLIFPKPDG
jgi:integrase